jgi:hypothetical protein
MASFVDIWANAWYLYILLLFSLLAIYTPFVDRYISRQPAAARAAV